MSASTVVRCKGRVGGRSYPNLSIPQLQRSRITKGIHLVSPRNKSNPEEELRAVKGVSLLSVPPTCFNTPSHTPRQAEEYNENVEDEADRGTLSVVGERLESFSNMPLTFPTTDPLFRINNVGRRPIPIVNCENDFASDYLGERYLSYDDIVVQSTSLRSFDFASPEVPSTTPFPRPGSNFRDFKVDGQKLNCKSNLQIPSSKDFTPGYVKMKKYCCSRCELHMIGHEFQHNETECPFYAYQQEKETLMASYGDQMKGNPGTELSDFLPSQIALPASLRYTRICDRYEEMNDRRCVSQPGDTNEQGGKSEKRIESSISMTSVESKREKHEMQCVHETSVHEEQHALETAEDGVNSKLHASSENPGNEACSNIRLIVEDYTKESVENVVDTTLFSLSDDSYSDVSSISGDADDAVASHITSSSKPSLWNNVRVWDRKGTIIPTTPTHDEMVGAPKSVDDATGRHADTLFEKSVSVSMDFCGFGNAARNVNSNTTDSKELQDASESSFYIPSSGNKLHEILKDCADSLRSISKRNENNPLVNSDGRHFNLPDVPRRKDICYQPMIDKRYNRWKRKKRKVKKLEVSPAPSESSCEENIDAHHNPSNIRGRRRKKSHSAQTSGQEPYDASSEMTSSDANNTQTAETSRNDCMFGKASCSKTNLGLYSEDLIEELDQELTSFPALNSFHYPSSRYNLLDKPSLRESMLKRQPEGTGSCQSNRNGDVYAHMSNTQNLSDVAPPLLTREKEEKLDSLEYCLDNRSSKENTKGGIQYPNRYFGSVAKNTIFRVSYSIGEKIRRAAESENEIFIIKKSHQRSTAAGSARSEGTSRKSDPQQKHTLTATLTLQDLNTKTEADKLTLSHLLRSMSGKNKGNLSSTNSIKPDKKPVVQEDEELAPHVMKAKVVNRSTAKPGDEKEQSIDRRNCVADKIPTLDQGRPIGQRSNSMPTMQSKRLKSRPHSDISFSPAFTFSYFQLPRAYKLQNSVIERKKFTYC